MGVSTLVPIVSCLVACANAHTRVNNPVKDITGTQINCNVNGATAIPQTLEVPSGATFEFEWYHDVRGDDTIAAVTASPFPQRSRSSVIASASSNGNGAVWAKIASEGLSGGTWAVDKLIANKGCHGLTIPAWIAPGEYLIRAEIIGLHEADVAYASNSARGAQFYPSCTQIKVTCSGTTIPGQNFGFVGGYTYADPGITYSLYKLPTIDPYTAPGPTVWSPSLKAKRFEV
ncbi:hypothetical protein L873DRAFT_1841523 [Choiromyces venosus 120613-1]|uniref:AA9 family lytic polysaccharide monooxygenase n=1 Tax=Choiromyces venosus 120613-1 TaxID=1336337 RepID=A0A3N4K0Y4_9PEZI|nr:hypothetical protein L873DRAFT_1841523 [Choiromyces venosus 120613-1]